MFARKRIDRSLEHKAPGRAAHARVQPDSGLLAHRLPARLGISLIELAPKQSLEVRHLQLLDQIFVPTDGARNLRQAGYRLDKFVDHPVEMRRDERPCLGEDEPSLVVDPVERKASFKGRN